MFIIKHALIIIARRARRGSRLAASLQLIERCGEKKKTLFSCGYAFRWIFFQR